MFYVYGVNMSVAHKTAKKHLLTYEGSGEKRRDLSPSEYEQKLAKRAEANFSKMKPVRLSHSLSTPTLCKDFIALARRTEPHKHLEVRYKKPTGEVNPKTQKPILAWEVYTGLTS